MPGKALFHSVFAEASALQQCLGRSPLLWRIPDVKPNFSISRIFLEGKKKAQLQEVLRWSSSSGASLLPSGHFMFGLPHVASKGTF